MHPNATEDVLAKRFHVERAPTLVARVAAKTSITFTHLKLEAGTHGRSMSVPCDDAFTFQVPFSSSFFSDIRIGGRRQTLSSIAPGDVCLFDLSDNPTGSLKHGFNNLRIYLPQAAIDELTFERGLRRVAGLRAATFGGRDMIVFGLSQAVVAAMTSLGGGTALFTDHVALALHDHVIRTYGGAAIPTERVRSGLAPWQLRRVNEFIDANLGADSSIAELAKECRLSSPHFSRAFKRTMGVPPHQWLIKRRIQRVKELLQKPDRSLADIALACGFADQSHLTRAFTQREGCAPGAWRRRHGIEPSNAR
jgi:AraC-like DNA-binding protein